MRRSRRASGGSVLELIDVSKSYHGILAVKPMSVSLRPGEVLGLLGPNGSGKSTTARMVVGLLPPTTGHVRWNGIAVGEQLMTYRANIGYVPEEPHLYSYLTATEYLQLIGGLRGLARPVLASRIARYPLDAARRAIVGRVLIEAIKK